MDRASNRRTPTRPPLLRPLGAAFPKGPRALQVPKAQRKPIGGPGEPPPGFVSPTTSRTEWLVYWGLAKILGQPKDPRRGPWVGFPPLWSYQNPFKGGRQIKGGAVIDFLVQPNRFNSFAIAIRLQTEFFHLSSVGGNKVMHDRLQEAYISSDYQVRDIYELSFINDPSGAAVCRELIRTLSGFSQPDPVAGGTTTVVRDRT
jgi:hypothetical protein